MLQFVRYTLVQATPVQVQVQARFYIVLGIVLRRDRSAAGFTSDPFVHLLQPVESASGSIGASTTKDGSIGFGRDE